MNKVLIKLSYVLLLTHLREHGHSPVRGKGDKGTYLCVCIQCVSACVCTCDRACLVGTPLPVKRGSWWEWGCLGILPN